MPVIDGHAHVQKKGNPGSSNPLLKDDLDWEAPVEQLLGDMGQAGVDQAVIVAMTPHRENHRYLAQCMERHPGRFAAIGGLDQSEADPNASYLRDAEEFGLQGVRARGFAGLDDSPSLLAALAELGHCLWLFADADQFDLIPEVCRRYPDLKVVLNLLGLPWSVASSSPDEHGRATRRDTPLPAPNQEPVLKLSDQANVAVQFGNHFQYSSEPHPHLDLQGMSERLLAAFGADRLMWMTNWPWIREVPGYRASTEVVDAHLPGISDSERAAIMGGTCAGLLSFD